MDTVKTSFSFCYGERQGIDIWVKRSCWFGWFPSDHLSLRSSMHRSLLIAFNRLLLPLTDLLPNNNSNTSTNNNDNNDSNEKTSYQQDWNIFSITS
jgi:hypothetical protein